MSEQAATSSDADPRGGADPRAVTSADQTSPEAALGSDDALKPQAEPEPESEPDSDQAADEPAAHDSGRDDTSGEEQSAEEEGDAAGEQKAEQGGEDSTGSAPEFTSVEVTLDPDDGADHHANSIQVATDVKLTLKWEATNATSVCIEGLGDFDASGEQAVPSEDASYTLVAKGEGGAASAPWPMEIHTHDPSEVVSPHVELGSGVAAVVSFNAKKDDEVVSEAKVGDAVELVLVVSDACESAKIADQDVDLADTGDGYKQGSFTVTIAEDETGAFEAQVMKDGEVADKSSLQVDILPAGEETEKKKTVEEKPDQDQAPGTLSGVLDGPAGPLKDWPFVLKKDGQPIGQDDLGEGKTENQFKNDRWFSDDSGAYKFEGMAEGSYTVELILPGGKLEPGQDAAASDDGVRDETPEPLEAALSHGRPGIGADDDMDADQDDSGSDSDG